MPPASKAIVSTNDLVIITFRRGSPDSAANARLQPRSGPSTQTTFAASEVLPRSNGPGLDKTPTSAIMKSKEAFSAGERLRWIQQSSCRREEADCCAHLEFRLLTSAATG